MVKVDLKDLQSEFLKEYGFFGVTKIKAVSDYVATATEEKKKETLLLKYLKKFVKNYVEYVKRNNNDEEFFVTEDEFMAFDEYCEFWLKQFKEKKGE